MPTTEEILAVFGDSADVIDELQPEIGGEFRVFGPPGTGKTTYLQRAIIDAANKHGSNSIVVASFTKSAAAELVSRDLPLRDEQIGTLHAHCYHAIGRRPIAETKLAEWNIEQQSYAMSGEGVDKEEKQEYEHRKGVSHGDELFAKYNFFRAVMRPREIWPSDVLAFAAKWEGWKRSSDYIDFRDMIEIALSDVDHAPGRPSIGFFDECQDFDAMELRLVRKWGKKMDFFICAGDDDQAIYGWIGATPEAFLDPPVDSAHKRVLNQSYRVPRAVAESATRWISRVKRREPKEYRPKDLEGEVRREQNIRFNKPYTLIDDMQKYLDAGKSVMVLASASYMIDPLKSKLREDGIPFQNPYRRSRGDWNPLNPSRGVSTSDRILAFLRPMPDVWGDEARIWNGADMKLWHSMILSDQIFVRGAREKISMWPDKDAVDFTTLQSWLRPGVFTEMMECDLEWLNNRVNSLYKSRVGFPFSIAKRYGGKKLRNDPQVIIGTIHSVKGGEADVVYVFPDISLAAGRDQEARKTESGDELKRLFYVAMTRAKESLIICGQCSPYQVSMM